MKRYQLRYAAGTYWLSDTEPGESEIKRPLELNETAAGIWKMLESGKSTKEIAEYFSEGNEEQTKEIQEDVEQFIQELRDNMIEI
ncbi:MAG: PqqD family protein [Eubacterium sp.]